jgi:hypothetical protein
MESYFERSFEWRSFEILKEQYSKEKKQPCLVPLIFGRLGRLG